MILNCKRNILIKLILTYIYIRVNHSLLICGKMDENILTTFKPVYYLNRIFGVMAYPLLTSKILIVDFIRCIFYIIVYGICAYQTKNTLAELTGTLSRLLLLISSFIMGAISIFNFINSNLICKKVFELLKRLTDIAEILQRNQIKIRDKNVQIFLIFYIVIKCFKLSILQTFNIIEIASHFNKFSNTVIPTIIYNVSTLIDLCVECQLLYFLYYNKEISQALYLHLNQKYLKRCEKLPQTLNDINRIYKSNADLAKTVNRLYNTYIVLKFFNTFLIMVASAFLLRDEFHYISAYPELIITGILWLHVSIYGTFVFGYMFEMTAVAVSKSLHFSLYLFSK